MTAPLRDRRFLVIVADDFGRSPSVNHAVAEAHDNGILTSASLMAGGASFDEAVGIARERKNLSAGLHVTLCDGRAVSLPSRIPDLVDSDGNFEKDPVKAWLKYSGKALRSQIETEVEAQFKRLESAGISPSHVDGHHHLQMHPVLFRIICRQASKRRVGWIRIPREPLKVVVGMRSPSRGAMPYLEWAVFSPLGACNKREACQCGVKVPDSVYGLSRSGGVDEEYLCGILDMAVGPVDEIFTHPDISTGPGRIELRALTSHTVRDRLISRGTTSAGYGELSGAMSLLHFAGERT
jgi:hopanoid biosynthesis associated protein HpnK